MVWRSWARLAALATGLVPIQAAAQGPAQDSVRADSTAPFVLEAVTVTVTRSQRAVERVPYAVSVVDREQIQLGRVTDGLDEALAAFAGVLVSNRYNYSLDQRVAVRGFGARSAFGVRGVKILLDGVPQTLPDGQGQLTNVELAEVSRIEVLRSSSSSLYGNASGGVISIWTASEWPRRFEPTIRATAGAYGFRKWVVGGAVPAGGGSVAVTTSRVTTDGFREHSAADIRRAALRVSQPVGSRTTLGLTVHVADEPVLDNPGALTQAQVDSSPSVADRRNVAADAGKAVTQAQAAVSLAHRLPGGGEVSGSVFGLRRDLENPLAFAFIQLDRWAYGLRAVSTVPVGRARAHLVTVGLDAQWQRDDRINWSPDRSEVRLEQLEHVFELGPFGQVALALSPRTTLTVGARYDRVRFRADDRLLDDGTDDSGDRVMAAVSATAGVTHRVTAGFVPYASVGTAFETPTTTELVNRPDGAGGFNPDLNPQRATNYELGFRGRAGGDRLSYAVAGFYSAVRDLLIPFEVPGAPNRQFFRNAGSARHRGIELEVGVRAAAGLRVLAAYTFADHAFRRYRVGADTLDGNQIPGVPRHYAHVSVRYRFGWGAWAALDNTHSGGYFADDGNLARTANWTVTGVRVGWEGTIAGWRIAPYAGVLNLFDRRYVGSVVVNARGGRYYEPAAPRNAYIGLSFGAAR